MNKFDALKFIQSHADFQNPDDQALIQDEIMDREPKAPKVAKAKKTVTVKASKKNAPSLDSIKARAKKPAPTVEDVLDAFSSESNTDLA